MNPSGPAPAAIPAGALDPWVLAYDGVDSGQEGLREALCALGNGIFVTRGAAEEADADGVHYPGTYLAGGYNRLASEVAGRTVVNEDLVNLPNWLPLSFRPGDGEWLDLAHVQILAYRQELHLRDGLLLRRFRVRDPNGRVTAVETRRIVSMARPNLAAIDYRITPENWSGTLHIRSELDGTVVNAGVARYRQLANRHLEVLAAGTVPPEGVYLLVQTTQSRIRVAEAARTRLYLGAERLEPDRRVVEARPGRIGEELRVEAVQGRTLRVEKVVALYSSRDRGISEPGDEARIQIAAAPGFEELFEGHRLAWHALWRRYDIEIDERPQADGPARVQLILRLHIFHLLQTISPNTVGLDVGAPARGLHGEAYRGHVFWDELFILPFYSFRTPAITRSLLLYRYHRLGGARELARQEGYAGAMYPWQSGSDGREATQQVHLNPLSGRWMPDSSHLQRHVDAAIVYNIWRYYEATGDRELLLDYGAEMVLEIARFWASIARWNPERGRYEITGVMGPDEYHERSPGAAAAGVANNAYTNVMAVWCLLRAFDVLDEVGATRRAELMARLGLDEGELQRWEHITRTMLVPFHADGVISQFEGYEALEEFDWAGYRAKYGNIERLDRILEAEGDTPDRYKVSKQPDAMMLFYLLDERKLREIFQRLGYRVDESVVRRTIAYYMERTSHGSTLSKTIIASVMHRLDREEGYRLFRDALRSDVDDIQRGTTPEGIHLGAMAGTVATVLRRYAGVELMREGVRFAPEMPQSLRRLRFFVHWRGRWLGVDLTHDRLRLTAEQDLTEPVPVAVRDAWLHVGAGAVLEVPL
mgnify:FL=1